MTRSSACTAGGSASDRSPLPQPPDANSIVTTTDDQAPWPKYHPFYCEENAWWLCADPALGPGPRDVLFVLSEAGACPVAAQRAAPVGEACWWDYHVVVLDGSTRIWDPDSRLGCPVAADDWLAGSFPSIDRLPAAFKPLFRRVPAADYRARLATDRSHMRDTEGNWLHAPPPWPPPWPAGDQGIGLDAYRSLGGDGPGELLSFEALRARVVG